jgi:hypothetical protein
VWPDPRVVDIVEREYLPVRVHVRDQAEEFQRLGGTYGAEWIPTILMLDPSGKERHRMEGFLPLPEFLPHLEFGLGRIDFARGEFESAERRLRDILREHPEADVAPEALYWAGVSRYKGADDSSALEETASALRDRYPNAQATKKASVWEQR